MIGGGRTERSITAREVALSLMKRKSAGPGPNPTATCRPAENAHYFDCRVLYSEAPGQSDEAALSFYDWQVVKVPAQTP